MRTHPLPSCLPGSGWDPEATLSSISFSHYCHWWPVTLIPTFTCLQCLPRPRLARYSHGNSCSLAKTFLYHLTISWNRSSIFLCQLRASSPLPCPYDPLRRVWVAHRPLGAVYCSKRTWLLLSLIHAPERVPPPPVLVTSLLVVVTHL